MGVYSSLVELESSWKEYFATVNTGIDMVGIESEIPCPELREDPTFKIRQRIKTLFIASDMDPNSPQHEKTKEDIDNLLSILKVTSDRVREARNRNKCPKTSKEVWTILDTPALNANKYESLRDKAKQKHRLVDGHIFGKIDEG